MMEDIISNIIYIKEEVDSDAGMSINNCGVASIKVETDLQYVKIEDEDEEYGIKKEPDFVNSAKKEADENIDIKDEKFAYENREKSNLDSSNVFIYDGITSCKLEPLDNFCNFIDGNCSSESKSSVPSTCRSQNLKKLEYKSEIEVENESGNERLLLPSSARLDHRNFTEREKNFKCSYCKYSSAKKAHLDNHVRTHTGEKPFKCNYCDYAAADKTTLRNHLRTHTGEKPFKCSYCDYASSINLTLKRHLRTHTGEKPFQCNYCDYTAADSSYLKKHLNTHTGERPFKCTYCDYAAARKESLESHLRTHTGEKPFKCIYCNYAATEKTSLRYHLKSHTGEKPFKCNYCDYASAHRTNLRNHLRTHSGEKPFKCNHCDYAAILKTNLERHRKIHTGEKPFKCNYCDYASMHKTNLERHLRTHPIENSIKYECNYTPTENASFEDGMHTGEKPFKLNNCDHAEARA